MKDNHVLLYKYMFQPDLQPPTLAVIGCIQPNGSIWPIAELQSRLATRVFKVRLPHFIVTYVPHQFLGISDWHWPQRTTLAEKLSGPKEDLLQATNFISAIKLDV